MKLPTLTYRHLFFVAVAVAAVSVFFTFRAVREAREWEQMVLRPTWVDPRSFDGYRDRGFDFTVENNGFIYRGTTGNIIDDSVLLYGAWEKDTLYFLRDYVRALDESEAAFIDVGANTGSYSLFMAPFVKEVHAIEPYPPVLEKLHELIRLNDKKNIQVHEVGLGDREMLAPFLKPPEANHGVGTFRAELKEQQQREEYSHLKIVTADEWFKERQLPAVAAIKIDIEGFEEAALKGMRQTLETHRPLVVLELSRPPVGTINSEEQLRGLFPANYHFLYLVQSREKCFSGDYELADFGPKMASFFATGFQVDLVAYPEEKGDRVPRRRSAEARKD